MIKQQLNFGGPGQSRTVKTTVGNEYEVDAGMASAIQTLRMLPTGDIMDLLGITSSEAFNAIRLRKQNLSDRLLTCLRDKRWAWRDTGDRVEIDQGFVEDVLEADVQKQTIYRQLREYRMPIAQVKRYLRIFDEQMKEQL